MTTTTRKRAPGAGRKPLQPGGAHRITITLTDAELATLSAINTNTSAAVRKVIEERTMDTQTAILILAGKSKGNIDNARQALAAAVLAECEYGDPDSSLMDWIAAGSYTGNETVESIAEEWDERGE